MSGTTVIVDYNRTPAIIVDHCLGELMGLKLPHEYINRAGIYLFTHMETGMIYIGSAVCFDTRFKGHLLNSTRLIYFLVKSSKVIITYGTPL